MIVFYLKNGGNCMLDIDCEMSEITISNNKAYYNGAVVINNMAVTLVAEVPKQPIRSLTGTPLLFSALASGTVIKNPIARISALEATAAKTAANITAIATKTGTVLETTTKTG